ncbi:Aldehyde/histidinol dehydrogenase [Podospora aff. communis PSN243]|uniref:Aldehyde/histidinol dehydrogenase n=1 Tax=Podospora aff. communis PSN243 TaxID=3040156 RepID=A0AAV9G7A0_9PEZI|nr:Aldehyde/histidinol dehydrogenase [Podospora aff. communis PSN243]
MSNPTPLSRLSTSALELLPSSPRHQQSQLSALHSALRSHTSALLAALTSTTGHPRITTAEAEAEYASALDAIRHFYDSVDPKKALEEEYAVAKGRNNESRRVPVGVVVVRPGWYTRLWSVVVPVAAAVAGGNCVVVELPTEGGHEVDVVLKEVLTEVMDGNTFWVSEGAVEDEEFLRGAVVVDQRGEGGLGRQVVSSSKARVVAVVDRTADVEEAARAITRARFSFGGGSPYAPDLVLVNEFVKTKFYEACSRYATRAFADRQSSSAEELGPVDMAVEKAEAQKQVVSFGGQGFKLLDILDRDTPLSKMKITGQYLPIATCSSLVDAVFSQEFENPLLAGYFFADPPSAKYLAQYLPCHISCVNHIPTQLLLGPAAPVSHGPDLAHRYNAEMFSLPRPQYFVSPAPTDVVRVAEDLLGGKGAASQKLRALATRPLKPTGQPKTLETLDFFASGLFLSGGLFLALVLPTIGSASYVLAKGASGYFGRLKG